MPIPPHSHLPVHLLAACFNNTSATYKYYWFLSILQAVEQGHITIDKRQLFAGMVSNAWYTVNYFHVSFGKQDKLQRAIEALRVSEAINIDEKRDYIQQRLIATQSKQSQATLSYFNSQVPHWFLSPWYPGADKKEIYEGSNQYDNNCLYASSAKSITINPKWGSYLTDNVRVFKDFCYWSLALYLQAKNQNAPDIPGKLIKPAVRNSLNGQRKNFWNVVLRETGSVDCIYTGEKLSVGKYAVEHFIPFAFVSHDLMWNLIPADPSFSCTKRDKLPSLDKYFEAFYALQAIPIEVVQQVAPKDKYLEDYVTILPEISLIKASDASSKQRYEEQLQPLITNASNNGFEYFS